jgi:hypothetical protein
LHDGAFGSATDGSTDVTDCGSAGSAGEYKSGHGGEGFGEGVYLVFQLFYLGGGEYAVGVQGAFVGIGGEVAADDKQFILYVEYGLTVVFFRQIGVEQSQLGVEFVYGAVGFQTDAVLGYAFASHEGGLSPVSTLRVYLHSYSLLEVYYIVLFVISFVEHAYAEVVEVERENHFFLFLVVVPLLLYGGGSVDVVFHEHHAVFYIR